MRPRFEGRAGVSALVLVTSLLPAKAEESSPGEVRLPSVAIGKTYSTWRLNDAPLLVRNPTDDTIVVQVELQIPARHLLRRGALPVADRTWIELERSEFVLSPRRAARLDVRLSLPYDPDLAGHLYQVDVRITTRTRADGTPIAEQRHHLLFSVEMDYRDDTEIDLTGGAVGTFASR